MATTVQPSDASQSRQGKKARGGGVERADFPLDRTVHHVPHAGDHRLLVHIQTGAMWM
jgi:hypothetical protein